MLSDPIHFQAPQGSAPLLLFRLLLASRRVESRSAARIAAQSDVPRNGCSPRMGDMVPIPPSTRGCRTSPVPSPPIHRRREIPGSSSASVRIRLPGRKDASPLQSDRKLAPECGALLRGPVHLCPARLKEDSRQQPAVSTFSYQTHRDVLSTATCCNRPSS